MGVPRNYSGCVYCWSLCQHRLFKLNHNYNHITSCACRFCIELWRISMHYDDVEFQTMLFHNQAFLSIFHSYSHPIITRVVSIFIWTFFRFRFIPHCFIIFLFLYRFFVYGCIGYFRLLKTKIHQY